MIFNPWILGGAILAGVALAWLKGQELLRKDTITPSSSIPDSPVTLAPNAPTSPPRRGQKHLQHQARLEAKKVKWPRKVYRFASGLLPSKVRVEIFEYGVKVAAAAVGLYLTFSVNAWKAQEDKKSKVITLMRGVFAREVVYEDAIKRALDAKDNLGDANIYSFRNMLRDHPYPYFSDIHDQAIWDVSYLTFPNLEEADYQIKFILRDSLNAKNFLNNLDNLAFYVRAAKAQITDEIEFQRGNDSAKMTKRSNDITVKLDHRMHRL